MTFEDDPDYGQLVSIQKLSGLHRAIGLRIIEKPEPMSGHELRFLRKQLGLTQAALAHKVQLCDQTIANYEKGVTPNHRPGRCVAQAHIRGFACARRCQSGTGEVGHGARER